MNSRLPQALLEPYALGELPLETEWLWRLSLERGPTILGFCPMTSFASTTSSEPLLASLSARESGSTRKGFVNRTFPACTRQNKPPLGRG